MRIKVAIVEDNKDIRKGLMILINSAEDLECSQTFNSAEEAIKNLPINCADVVLMDIDLPVMNGIECIKILKETCIHSQFMMLTVFEDDSKIFQSLKAGANGYLLKKSTPTEIVSSIKDMANGGSPMNTQIARRVVASFQHEEIKTLNNTEELTKREVELLELLAQGYRYKGIAEKLIISVDTVRTHIRNIYVKLQVNSKTEAINKIYRE